MRIKRAVRRGPEAEQRCVAGSHDRDDAIKPYRRNISDQDGERFGDPAGASDDRFEPGQLRAEEIRELA